MSPPFTNVFDSNGYSNQLWLCAPSHCHVTWPTKFCIMSCKEQQLQPPHSANKLKNYSYSHSLLFAIASFPPQGDGFIRRWLYFWSLIRYLASIAYQNHLYA